MHNNNRRRPDKKADGWPIIWLVVAAIGLFNFPSLLAALAEAIKPARVAQPVPPQPSSARPPSAQALPQASPPQAPVEVRRTPPQFPPAGPSGATEEQRTTLAQLEQTCRYWTDYQASNGGYSAMQQAACGRMRDYAATTRQATLQVPRINAASVARSAPTTPAAGPVQGYQCGHAAFGSLEYRRCRAQQKEGLRRACANATQAAEGRRGDAYRIAKQAAEEICLAYRQYDIVR